MIDLSNRPVTKPAEKDRVKIGWSSSGPIFADEMAERSRVSTVRLALTEIADALGDVDASIEQYEEETRKVPKIAAEIARRLLSAGRAQEAWQTIDATEHRRRNSGWDWPDFEWEDARIDVLEALGRADDAQAARWGCFERSLSSTHLRAYLKLMEDKRYRHVPIIDDGKVVGIVSRFDFNGIELDRLDEETGLWERI